MQPPHRTGYLHLTSLERSNCFYQSNYHFFHSNNVYHQLLLLPPQRSLQFQFLPPLTFLFQFSPPTFLPHEQQKSLALFQFHHHFHTNTNNRLHCFNFHHHLPSSTLTARCVSSAGSGSWRQFAQGRQDRNWAQCRRRGGNCPHEL